MAVYLVTGAASGIGRAVGELALKDGHEVLCLDRDARVTEVYADRERARAVVGDITRPEDCAAAVAEAVAVFGRLDGLSHNAGIQRYGSAEDTPDETWNEVIAVNLTGGFNMARAALPEIRKAKGALVFTGSVQSHATQGNVAAYTAAKHGLYGLVQSIAVDFAAEGVRANLVAPGSVRTPMLEWAVAQSDDPAGLWRVLDGMHPMGRIAEPEEVAGVILFLLSERARFVTGESVRVDGGLLSIIPGTPKESV
ncbi:SDR family NAD(P)-dependent oxidoreductase [Histidinibacterium lentulum]|uniref:SDR family oxidoreductase n=1 Tax=Histidinibacterium lentulum TaxID=2480588 RepID=A0A3N2R8B9_9RHOB|nr:SDR family oxidoreductase [Histidinibacterium lentulum]ROU03663.1 SDR family oxidoreductase [Histidinibacterium lentulum]